MSGLRDAGDPTQGFEHFPDKYSVNWATPPTWKRLILGTCNYVYLRSRIQEDADGWSLLGTGRSLTSE